MSTGINSHSSLNYLLSNQPSSQQAIGLVIIRQPDHSIAFLRVYCTKLLPQPTYIDPTWSSGTHLRFSLHQFELAHQQRLLKQLLPVYLVATVDLLQHCSLMVSQPPPPVVALIQRRPTATKSYLVELQVGLPVGADR